ncbi:MAG: GTP cyclohydrolase II [Candidatus Pacebacteria bacterium]|nr:GTP cyclohydrolase II [Candidatus Paceibacterota bacterium]MDD5356869.1 GTP cyclohydrolase II [Candidatus Paceibacterota bacterium]
MRKKDLPKVKKVASTLLPTVYGDFTFDVFEDAQGREHIVLSAGNIKKNDPLLLRIHSSCITSEIFLSGKCDCRGQLLKAMKIISEKGGAIIYLQEEGRGIGLTNKIRAYKLQAGGLDTVEANEALNFPADLRDYGVAISILAVLGKKRVKLLTNNPAKVKALEGRGIKVVEQLPLEVPPTRSNKGYLLVKKNKLGHRLKIR